MTLAFVLMLAVSNDHCPRSINLRLQGENILILISPPSFISWSMSREILTSELLVYPVT